MVVPACVAGAHVCQQRRNVVAVLVGVGSLPGDLVRHCHQHYHQLPIYGSDRVFSLTLWVLFLFLISPFPINQAAFGYLLFGEQITVQWAVGITFLLIGMTLLKTTDAKDEAKKKKKKK